MAQPFCDSCAREIPAQDLTLGKAALWRGRILCAACLPKARRRAAVGYGAWGVLAAVAAVGGIWSIGRLLASPPKPEIQAPDPLLEMKTRMQELRAEREALAERVQKLEGQLSALQYPTKEEFEEHRKAAAGAQQILSLAQEHLEEKHKAMEDRVDRLEQGGIKAPSPSTAIPAPAANAEPSPAETKLAAVRAKLNHTDPKRRWQALWQIADEKLAPLAPEAAYLLKDDFGYVRREAARVLGEFKVESAIRPLLNRLSIEEDLLVKNRICLALGAITGTGYDPLSGADKLPHLRTQWEQWADQQPKQ